MSKKTSAPDESARDIHEMATLASLVQYGGVGQRALCYQAVVALYEGGPTRRTREERDSWRDRALAAEAELRRIKGEQ